ncbi:MAG: tandem-95 repeat protein [Bacteroidetes bacterium]|nr:tandem-95 repeat protein [Bacteroidota bacterium]
MKSNLLLRFINFLSILLSLSWMNVSAQSNPFFELKNPSSVLEFKKTTTPNKDDFSAIKNKNTQQDYNGYALQTLLAFNKKFTPANTILTAPLAENDNYILDEDVTLTITDPLLGLLANDSDPDLDNLTVSLIPVTLPTNGTVTINPDGTFEYIPNPDFNGTDSFEYEVCDDAAIQECSKAIVSLTISAVNDAPIALDDITVPPAIEDTPYTGISLLINDTDPDLGDLLTITSTPILGPTHGGVTIHPDGTYTYTALPNYFGTDSFTYEVCDNGSPILCANATVNISITGVPDPPAVGNDFYATNEDITLNGSSLLSNDLDFDSQLLVINTSPISAPSHGNLIISPDGTFSYTPQLNFNGSDSFVYEVCDDGIPSECSQGIVSINVNPLNDAPIAGNDTVSTNEDNALVGNTVLANDSDPDTNTLSVNTVPVLSPANGSLSLNSDGTYLYTPFANYNGIDSFIYSVCDNGSPVLCTNATVNISIVALNDAPIAANDVAVTNEDVVLNGATVLSNDSDVDGNPLTVNTTPITLPLHGAVNLNSNGTYTYTPDLNYTGSDSFVYEICDNGTPTLCATALVTITINPIADTPIANSDNYTTNEDALLNGTSVLANDSDGDGDALTVSTIPVSNVTHGVLILNSDGTFIYIPTANYNGSDSFVYQVCDGSSLCSTTTVIITINAVNDSPVVVNDLSSVNEDNVLNGSSVLINDSDPESNTLTVNTIPISGPSNGILALSATGTYTYSPSPNYNGTDSFTYQVCDNGIPSVCATGTVTITVNAVNDAPTLVNNVGITSEDVSLIGTSLLANDSDVDGNILSINTTPIVSPVNGILVINANGTYSYSPNLNFNGTDSFVYQACDNGSPSLCANASVALTINAVNDLPLAVGDVGSTAEDVTLNGTSVLANDSDPEGNTLTVSAIPLVAPAHGTVNINSNGTYVYTPFLNYHGTDSFVYEVCDNASPVGCSSATVTITITSVNDAPLAVANAFSTNEDTPLNGTSILLNDSDVDGDPTTLNTIPTVLPLHGSITLNGDGTFTYIPAANYSGSDSFTYRICDNGVPALCSTALVSITVNPVNDAPVAVNGAYSTSEDTPLTGSSVLGNDSDPDGDLLSVNTTPLVNVSSGILNLNSDGTFTYTPVLNFNGTVSFVYQVCDNAIPSLCSQATTTIDVLSVNDAPAAVADAYSTNEDTPLNGSSVLINDSDVEGNTITVNTTPVSLPVHGNLVLNINGTFTYTPAANYNGSDNFVYQICDNGVPSLCSNATVTITIVSVNDTPIATDDNGTTLENIVLNGTSVLTNDSDPENGVLTVNTVPVTNVAHGTLTLNSNGTYVYTPNLNYNGFDFFVYSACDNGTPIACATATVTISIGSVNQFPLALNDAISTNEDTPNSDNVLTNDSDPDLDLLTVTALTNFPTLHGKITIAANGAYTYTPNLNYNGSDIFTYQVCDNGNPLLCSNASINITVNPVNDSPVAVNDNVSTPEDTPLLGTTLLTNDLDVDGNTLTVSTSPLVPPAHGTLLLNSNGTYTYTPSLNYVGGDTFVYEVCDNGIPSACSNAVVLITISPVNDAPSANNDTYVTNEDVVLNASSVLLNDSDQDGNALQVTGIAITPPAHGNLVLNANGTFIFTPFANYNGTDSFVYQVCDNAAPSLCSSATVNITINSINDAPVALLNAASTAEDTPINGASVLLNDTDPDGNPITINTSPAVNPIHGTVVLNADGTYLYTPVLNYSGSDSFTYQICDNGSPVLCATAVVSILITAVNDAPVTLDDFALTNEDTPLNGTTVLSNDSDPDGNPIVVTIAPISPPAHGNLTLNANGTYAYVPFLNYNGLDSFVYQACDNGVPPLCSTSTVTITINAINDAPLAANDSYTVAEDGSLIGTSLLLNDTDPEGGVIVINTVPVTVPAHGTLLINPNGTFTYTPNSNYNGVDSFVYQVCDAGIPVACSTATVTITVTPVNDAPIAADDNGSTLENTVLNGSNLLSNDSDLDGNPLTITTTPVTPPVHGIVVINSNGTYTYSPNFGYSGFDSFVYQVCDNGSPVLCDNATVTIGIGAVNHSPQPLNDAFTTNENIVISGSLATNDVDPDGNNLIYSITPFIAPSNGIAVINANGTFSYTPNLSFSGIDNFTYQVCDDGAPSLCVTASVSITVNPVNDAPFANADFTGTTEDTSLNGINLLLNDTDPDGNTISISTTPVNAPQHGTLQINTNGTYSYIPNSNYFGADSFVYQICDNGTPALCDTAIVLISITSVNDAPVVVNDFASTLQNTLVSGNVVTNDFDIDGPALAVSLLTNALNGNMVLNSNGTFNYTPDNGFIGNDSISYIVCDGGVPNLCDTATLLISVTLAPNTIPVANTDNYSVNEDNTLNTSSSILANDFDPDGNTITLTISPIVFPLNGTLSLNFNGTFSYTPDLDFAGTDSFVYQICDDGTPALCDTAIVYLTVNAVNDAPIAENDSLITLLNTSVNGDALFNDTDVDGPTAIASILSLPANGTVVMNGIGSFTYTPAIGFTGTDSFVYTVCDGGNPNLCAVATVIIVVNPLPPNQAPVANGDYFITNEDTQLSGSLSANDADPEGSTLIYSAFNGATPHGTIAISASGNYIYVPTLNYFGTDSFTYTVCDTATPALCDTAIVTFTINAINDAPIAQNDTANILQGTAANGNVLNNDSDIEGATLNSSLLVIPINGVAVINPNGSFSYTPNSNFVGTDIFSYLVCDGGSPNMCDTALVVINVDAPPCAGYLANSDNESTNEDFQLIISELTNDNVILTNILVGISTNPLNGSVVINANNTITYTPNLNFNGNDSFVYTVGKPSGGPSICDTAIVNIAIIAINDAPIAVDDTVNTPLGTAVSGNVLLNDLDVDDPLLSTTQATAPSNGTLVFNTNGTFIYTPFAGFLGSDSFTYIVCDGATPQLCDTGLVTIFVTGQLCGGFLAISDTASVSEDNTLLLSVLANDTVILSNVGISITLNPLHGSIIINANNTISYSPNVNYFGTDSFIYAVLDTSLPNPVNCDTALVKIKVIAVNDSPLAKSDNFQTFENVSLNGNCLINDSDIDLDSLQTTVISQPSNGTLNFNLNGTFTYIPNAQFIGNDSFIYSLCDLGIPSLCDTAIVNITVLRVNKAPFAMDDTVSLNQGDAVTRNVLVNDMDPDLTDLLSISLITTPPQHGGLTLAADGTFTYTPDELYAGTDSFAYEVCDDYVLSKLCATGIVRITINETPFTVPNAFSPDGDNINDFFVIKRIQAYPQNELRIFNRWGNLVYSKKGYDNTWNGKSSDGSEGKELASGSYYYILTFNDGVNEAMQGYIVIRK